MKPGFFNLLPVPQQRRRDVFEAASEQPAPQSVAAAPSSSDRLEPSRPPRRSTPGAPLKGKTCEVVGGPHRNKVMVVEDTTDVVLGIENPWKDPRVNQFRVFGDYFGGDPSPPECGRHYYGKIDGLAKIAHEDWLKPRD